MYQQEPESAGHDQQSTTVLTSNAFQSPPMVIMAPVSNSSVKTRTIKGLSK